MEEKKRITDAKPLSKWAMVLACAVFYLEAGVYILVKKTFPDLHVVGSMLVIAIVPIITFSPVYFQLFMDKLVKMHRNTENK